MPEGTKTIGMIVKVLLTSTAALLLLSSSVVAGRAASATDSPLMLSVDTRTQWTYDLDSTILRVLTVTNNGPAGIFGFTPSLPNNNPNFTGCSPSPDVLYLPAGGSGRIICKISFIADEPSSQGWRPGETHQVPLQIAFTQLTNLGSTSTPPVITPLQTVTLDNSVLVQQARNGPSNAPMAKPNATLAISSVDARSGHPIVGARVQIQNLEAGWSYQLAGGKGTVAISAHQRGVIPAWQPYVILAQARGYADLHVIVSPVAGKKTTVKIAMRPPSLRGSYKLIGSYDTGLPVGRGAVSADGHFLATVPFTDLVLPVNVAARGELDFFDTQAGKLLWHYHLGVAEIPSVDVSADGQFVVAIDPGPNPPNFGIAAFPYLTLFDHQGNVVWRVQAKGPSSTPTIALDGGPVVVKFSPDGRYLAYGSSGGRLLILDRASGAVRAQAFLGGQVRNLAWNGDGSRLYASSGDNNVYALDPTSGAVIWKTDIGGWALTWDVSAHEILVTAKTGYALTLLRTSDGSILWQRAVMIPAYGLAISPDEQLEASANTTAVYSGSGQPLWAVASSTNAVAFSGSKYVLFEREQLNPPNQGGGSDSLDLYAARSGELVWSTKLPGPSGDWSHGEKGVVYISRDASVIVAGGAETGRVYFFRGTVKTLAP